MNEEEDLCEIMNDIIAENEKQSTYSKEIFGFLLKVCFATTIKVLSSNWIFLYPYVTLTLMGSHNKFGSIWNEICRTSSTEAEQ